MTDLEKAKAKLQNGGYTCVLYHTGAVYTSYYRGVRPLVEWLESGEDFSGFCAADKVVGRATAFLYVRLSVTAVYAGVMSRAALEVLEAQGIRAEYASLVDHIINRRGDGICPFEEAVLDIQDPQEAYARILQKLNSMG